MNKLALLLFALLAGGAVFFWTRGGGDLSPLEMEQVQPVDEEEGASEMSAPSPTDPVLRAEAIPPEEDASRSNAVQASADTTKRTTLVVQVHAKGTEDPIKGAVVFLLRADDAVNSSRLVSTDAENPLPTSSRTDETGTSTFHVPHDVELEIRAHVDNDWSASKTLLVHPLDESETRTVTLGLPIELDAQYFGRVVAESDGSPISGAEIRYVPDSPVGLRNGRLDTEPNALSGPNGEFSLRYRSWRGENIIISADGFGPKVVSLAAGFEERAKARKTPLARSATLRGVVEGNSVGRFVHLEVNGFHLAQSTALLVGFGGRLHWFASLEGNGTFALSGLPPDVPLVASVRSGPGLDSRPQLELAEPLTLDSAEAREVLWTIGGGATIRGVVTDSTGGDLNDIELWLVRAAESASDCLEEYLTPLQKTKTDQAGSFEFVDVTAGTWKIGPRPNGSSWRESAPGSAVAPHAIEADVTAGDRVVDVELPIWRDLFIRGTVVGEDDSPRGRAHIWGLQERCYVRAQAERDGSFALGPLVPGSYQIHASGRDGDGDSLFVQAEAGDVDVKLVLPVGSTLAGKIVVAATSEPPSGQCEITLLRADVSSTTSFARQGSFEFDGLAEGEYTITALASPNLIGSLTGVRVEKGQQNRELVVSMEPGAELVVRYSGSKRSWLVEVRQNGSPILYGHPNHTQETKLIVPTGNLELALYAFDQWTLDLPAPVLRDVSTNSDNPTTIEIGDD